MQKSTKRIIFAILIILNCLTIFYFSNQIADNSSVQSSRVVEIVSNILPIIKNMQEPDKTILKEEILTPIVRKTAHFSIYAMLGIFTMNFVITYEKISFSKKIAISLLFCVIYAITDEFHQFFIQGRSAEIRDVLIDSSGAFVGILVAMIIANINRKWKNKSIKNRIVADINK